MGQVYRLAESTRLDILFGKAGDESRAFGGAPRSAIINCRLCLHRRPYSKSVRQSARSHSRLHPRLSSVNALSSKKKRTHEGCVFFLEQVTRVELAGNSLGSCRHTARRHLHKYCVFIIQGLSVKVNDFSLTFLFFSKNKAAVKTAAYQT